MTGTILNVIAILAGGGLGMLFGSRIPERLKQTVVSGMGLFTAAMGLQMFFKTGNPLIVLGSLLVAHPGQGFQFLAALLGIGPAVPLFPKGIEQLAAHPKGHGIDTTFEQHSGHALEEGKDHGFIPRNTELPRLMPLFHKIRCW